MEKAVSVEERIRRAEDIYNKRNGINTKDKRSSIRINDKGKVKKRNIKKVFIQIFVCLLIYLIFYVVTNRKYIFSEEFRNNISTFFNEKTIISDWYNKAKDYIYSILEEEQKEEDNAIIIEDNEKKEEENILKDNNEKKETEKTDENKEGKQQNNEENIGGASDNAEKKENKKNEKLTEQQIMEKEAKEIKKNIKFIKPVNGRISSTFGWRNPTTNSVPKYHTGVDIAAIEGTKIKSATDGKVIMASAAGDYGNHYQIQIKDIIIIYAHCKKLYLKEGDFVKQGQEIAEVGSTGNSTGPHLHFEIRKNGRKIDPQLVLNL